MILFADEQRCKHAALSRTRRRPVASSFTREARALSTYMNGHTVRGCIRGHTAQDGVDGLCEVR